MQTTTPLYQTILADDNHWFETQVIIDGVTYDETKLFSVSTHIEMFQETPTIGKAAAGEINIKMLKPSVDIPAMAKIQPQVRVCRDFGEEVDDEWVVTRQNSEWLAQGIYYIDTRETTKNQDGLDVLTIHGYDDMLKAEQMFQSDTITGDSTTIEMVDAIAALMGVDVDQRTYDLITPQYEWEQPYTVPLPTGYSCREVLGYIASMYVGCFIMSEIGELRLVSLTELPPETNYLIDEDSNAIVFGTGVTDTKTKSGNPVSFNDGCGNFFTTVTANLPFSQGGSGVQTPTNPRPFTKYSSVSIFVGAQSGTADKEYKSTLNMGYAYEGSYDITTGKISTPILYENSNLSVGTIHLVPPNAFTSATILIPVPSSIVNSGGTLLCDLFEPVVGLYTDLNDPWKCALVKTPDSTFPTYGIAFHGATGVHKDTSWWRGWFKDHPTTVLIRKVGSPVSMTVSTPQNIQNLTGQNYVWSSANSTVTVKYDIGGEQTRILV